MNRSTRSWLMPSALVAYVALAAIRYQGTAWSWLLLTLPVALAWSLRTLSEKERNWLLTESLGGVHATLLGVFLYLAILFGPTDNAAFSTASAAAQGSAVAGALLCVARLPAPPGLLHGHRAARSLDGLAVLVTVWSVVGSASLLRAIAPDLVRLDPQVVDFTFVFASVGSLLLMSAVLARARLLRGLEIGVGDRLNAGLALSLAGTLIGAATGLLRMSTVDRVAGATVIATASLVTWTAASDSAQQVQRTVRGSLALLVLGAPTALGGAWLATDGPGSTTAVVLTTAALSMLVGLIARAVANRLVPASARWLDAVEKAMDAALNPQPDLAIRSSLSALRRAERAANTRPEIFQLNPPKLMSVDVAGYLTSHDAEFPRGIFELAASEPGNTLRLETIEASEVRRPEVRPAASWFRAHSAKAATALFDDDGPVGLLVLPRGRRNGNLGIEEVMLLGSLAARLTGLISMTSGLARALDREREAKRTAEENVERLQQLEARVSSLESEHQGNAEQWVEAIHACAHGPAASMTLTELERERKADILLLDCPAGTRVAPWAAFWHLARLRPNDDEPRAPDEAARTRLLIQDCTQRDAREPSAWQLDSAHSVFGRVGAGTLVLEGAGALEPSQRELIARQWQQWRSRHSDARLVICIDRAPRMPRLVLDEEPALAWKQFVPDGRRALVRVPSLLERPEDLQALFVYELARLGMALGDGPLGLTRDALELLLERHFPGNDRELRGILTSAAAIAAGPRITVAELQAALAWEQRDELETSSQPAAPPRRRRSRRPPRSRR